MTVDLRDQLRELCAVIEDEQGPLTVDYVRSRSDALIASQRPSASLSSEITIIEETLDESGSLDASVDTAVDSAEAEADEQRGDDVMVDYLQQRPDKSDAPSERKGWAGVVIAVAATILVVVGVVIVADGNSGNVVTDPVSSPTEETILAPTADFTVSELVANFAYSAARVRVGDPVTFVDDSSGDPRSWTWDFGDGTFGSGPSVEHAWSEPGTYQVTPAPVGLRPRGAHR